jgi:hypothetical protein
MKRLPNRQLLYLSVQKLIKLFKINIYQYFCDSRKRAIHLMQDLEKKL